MTLSSRLVRVGARISLAGLLGGLAWFVGTCPGGRAGEAKAVGKQPSRIIFRLEGPDGPFDARLAAVTLDDKKLHYLSGRLSTKRFGDAGSSAIVSPDGKTVAYLTDEYVPPHGGLGTWTVHVRPTSDPKAEGRSLGVKWATHILAWSPDGNQLLVTTHEDAVQETSQQLIVDVRTKETQVLTLPHLERPAGADWFGGLHVTDWSPDGKWFLASCPYGENKGKHYADMYLVNSDGSAARRLKHIPYGLAGRFSPNGKRVLFIGQHEENGKLIGQLFVADLAGGKPVRVSQELTDSFSSQTYCWSPDGKRVAYVWENRQAMDDRETFLMVVDVDGRNPQVLYSHKSRGWLALHSPNWR